MTAPSCCCGATAYGLPVTCVVHARRKAAPRREASFVLARHWEVLSLLGLGGRWRVLSIARRLDIPKATVERALKTLMLAGFPLMQLHVPGQAQAREWSMPGDWRIPAPPHLRGRLEPVPSTPAAAVPARATRRAA